MSFQSIQFFFKFFFINNIIYIFLYNLKFWIGLIGAYLVFIFYVFPYYTFFFSFSFFFSKATSHYTVFRNLEKLIYDDKLIYWLFLINMRHRCNKHDFILSKINSKLFFFKIFIKSYNSKLIIKKILSQKKFF